MLAPLLTPLWFTLANGKKLCIPGSILDFSWIIQGQKFYAPMRILPLWGCDVQLWVEWLEENSPIYINFKKLYVNLCKDGQPINLFGKKEEAYLQLLYVDSLSKQFSNNFTILLLTYILSLLNNIKYLYTQSYIPYYNSFWMSLSSIHHSHQVQLLVTIFHRTQIIH